jgi:hypothetical protein
MRYFTLILLLFPLPAFAADVDFARDVLPILSENCFHCHGPDASKRSAGLRLDTKEGAFRTKNGTTTLVPGKSHESEVIRRILSTDADEVMPPPDSNRKITPKQRDILKTWVDQGAKWGLHWAFQPLPKAVAVPEVPNAKTEIDRFLLARLQQEKLTYSAPATPEAWLRRVTFDLTGLPPTLAEIDAFTADKTPEAKGKVLDKLFASPRYGERMATDWLDVARFADTHGYQSDRFRAMWAYRDWVINSFQSNQRYDQFLTEQLAGDLLPKPTQKTRLATAFNRLHMQNEEGGIVEEEFRVAYVADRVNTMGTTFLAMTFECTRCHDHKYDPLTQKDYYSLFAFFQNIDESGQTSYFTPAMPVPALPLTTPEQDKKLAELLQAIQVQEANVAKVETEARKRAETVKHSPLSDPLPGLQARYTFDDWKANSVPNSVDAKKPGSGVEAPKPVPGKLGQGAQLNGDNGFTFPGVGHFTRDDAFSFGVWVKVEKQLPRMVVLHHSMAPIDAGSRGYDLLLEDGHVAFGLYHMWPGNALKVRTQNPIKPGEWVHLGIGYEGSSRAAGVKVYVNGQPAATTAVRDNLTKDITYGSEPNLAIGHRFRDAGLKDGTVDEFTVFSRALAPSEFAHLAGKPSSSDGNSYLASSDVELNKAREQLCSARKAYTQVIHPIADVMVMAEMPTAKPAHILKRGAYDSLGDAVTPNTPAVLPGFTANAPRNRLGLSTWLTQPEHPLTARVIVNRLWQQMFGKGLVETSDNFGTTGTPPSHPELLDWLARDFVANGWDIQRTLRLMATSEAYGQSTKPTPEMLAKDPYNTLLARGPARRLTAEMLRDQALSLSGLLVEKVGGPSVYPYQPEGLWNETMGRPHYPQSKGADLYRRSLYTVWKRTAPHPQMTTFDAADRSVCTARRQATSTPLQSLALLNDPQIVEAARFLAEEMLKQKPEERTGWLFRRVTGRIATAKEVTILDKLFTEQLADFQKTPASAVKLLAVGDKPADTKADKPTLAAATITALAMLNHPETVAR